ncbi:UNVERIFIED_CONTAM: hypothetical protein Slati_3791600 [Sesamum latifolium]|uniref:Uncharacterized protein n=1 Tax=Sesamum latifolium TaxID=2727402 RepID=A0AAW2U508_9LAMI
MTNPNHPSAKLSPSSSCSSHFTPRTLFKFHYSPSAFPSKNPHKLTSKFLCSCQPSKIPNSDSDQDSNSSSSSTLLSILLADWADGIKERGMKQKRFLYDHENWVQHRSSSRHVRHFLSSLSSRVILSLVPPVIVFTSVAVIIASYNSAVSMHWLPEFFPVLRASSLPYQLTAPALALLLVFRTEASYSRFEEGKKAWTRVIAGTNDFAGQVIASVESPSDAMLKKAILQYIMAFPVALKCHIINGSDIAKDLKTLLEVDDLAVVLSSKHRPRCIIEFISQSLQLLDLETAKLHTLESKLCCFHEGIGVCEQLMGIPIPLSYTRLTSRFLVLWHFTLPIILWTTVTGLLCLLLLSAPHLYSEGGQRVVSGPLMKGERVVFRWLDEGGTVVLKPPRIGDTGGFPPENHPLHARGKGWKTTTLAGFHLKTSTL